MQSGELTLGSATVRVLHIIDHLGRGGGQISLKGILENFSDTNVEAILCTLRNAPDEVPIKAETYWLNYRRWDLRAAWEIVKICKKQNIQIIHPHLQKSIICSLLASFLYTCPVVVHIRGGVFLEGFSFVLYRQLLRILRDRAAIFITNSQATTDKLIDKIKVPYSKIRLVYNPIDFGVYEQQPQHRQKTRATWQVKDSDIVLGFVGRLHPVKGVDLLIKALSILLKSDISYQLVIAGDGPQRTELEEMVKQLCITEHVKFLGMVDNVAETASGFDISVVPSRHEPFGRVAVEFMRMKVPVISSGADGLSEIVHNNETGLITKENTPECIAQAIQRLVKNSELQLTLIRNGYIFSEQFSLKTHIAALHNIYNEVLQNKQRNN